MRGETRSRRRKLRRTARCSRFRDGIPPRAPPSAATSEIPGSEWLTRTWSERMEGSPSIEGRPRHCMAPAVRPLGSLSEAESVVASSPAIVDSPLGFASATAPESRASIFAEVSANLFYW